MLTDVNESTWKTNEQTKSTHTSWGYKWAERRQRSSGTLGSWRHHGKCTLSLRADRRPGSQPWYQGAHQPALMTSTFPRLFEGQTHQPRRLKKRKRKRKENADTMSETETIWGDSRNTHRPRRLKGRKTNADTVSEKDKETFCGDCGMMTERTIVIFPESTKNGIQLEGQMKITLHAIVWGLKTSILRKKRTSTRRTVI